MKFAHIRICITPPVGTGLCGYVRKATSTGITDDLYVQLLLLEDDRGRRLLLASADLIGFETEFVDGIKRWIGTQDERLTPASINFNASHTHGAPATMRIATVDGQRYPNDYTRFLRRRIKMAIAEVLRAPMETGSLHVGMGRCRLGINRRLPVRMKRGRRWVTEVLMQPNPAGSTDSVLGVLRVKGVGREILVVNYACHPTATGATYALTADYPGFASRALRAEGGQQREVMFLQGAGGDIRPPCLTGNGKLFKPAEVHEVAAFGQAIAISVGNVLRKKMTRLRPVFRAHDGSVLYPYDKQRACREDPFKEYAAIRDWRLRTGSADGINLKWTVWRLASQCCFIAVPGEACHMIGKKAKRRSGAAFPFFLGYTNGCPGYIPTDKIIREGGYEGFRSIEPYGHPHPFRPGAERMLHASLGEGLSACLFHAQ